MPRKVIPTAEHDHYADYAELQDSHDPYGPPPETELMEQAYQILGVLLLLLVTVALSGIGWGIYYLLQHWMKK